MFVAAAILMALSVLLFCIGWVLNTQTPIQQPLPAVAIITGLIASGIMLWFH